MITVKFPPGFNARLRKARDEAMVRMREDAMRRACEPPPFGWSKVHHSERLKNTGAREHFDLELTATEVSEAVVDIGFGVFMCEQCGGTFPKAWSDEECAAEAAELWTDTPTADMATVCEDCFELVMGGLIK